MSSAEDGSTAVTEHVADVGRDISLAYQTFGDPTDETMVLVQGLGCPMNWWADDFCTSLAERGFHVVRYDNRDVGRSTRSDVAVSAVDVVRAFLDRRHHGPYGITDLADDLLGLLDALDVDAAHLVGISMGGMIVQTAAVKAPERVRSLASIMSTTGRRTVGHVSPKLFPLLLSGTSSDEDAYVAQSVRTGHALAGTAYPHDDDFATQRAHETWRRGWSPDSVRRQMVAVLSQDDRTDDLHHLDVPTLVVHGTADPMVHPSGGRATASAVSRAALLLLEGVGHELPDPLWPMVAGAIADNARRTLHGTTRAMDAA